MSFMKINSPFIFTNLKDENQFKPITKALQNKLYSQRHPYLFGRKFAKDYYLTPLDSDLAYRLDWK